MAKYFVNVIMSLLLYAINTCYVLMYWCCDNYLDGKRGISAAG